MADADFDRSNPLFERTCVPCEIIRSAGGGSGDANNAPHGGGCNVSRSFYTLRILSGRRTASNGGGGTERAIRFELSDECCKLVPPAARASSTGDGAEPRSAANSFFSPGCGGRGGQQPSGGGGGGATPGSCYGGHNSHQEQPPHYPQQPGGPRPPVMMMQNRPPPPPTPDHYRRDRPTNYPHPHYLGGPVNLYELEVGENDFADLRRDQALLVDFGNFAGMFIDLLRFCDLGDEDQGGDENDANGGNVGDMRQQQAQQHQGQNQHQQQQYFGNHYSPYGHATGGSHGMMGMSSPATPYGAGQVISRYTCRLEDYSSAPNASNGGYSIGRKNGQTAPPPQARFSVVESNQFRELTHLALNMTKGTDSSVRAYLSSRLGQAMGISADLRDKLRRETTRSETAERSHRDVSERMRELALSAETEKRELKVEAGEAMHRESNRRDDEFRKTLEEKENEYRSLKELHEKVQEEMRSKIETLEKQRETLAKEKLASETENERLRNTLALREGTVQNLTEDLEAVRARIKDITEEKNRAEKSLHQTQLHVAALEQSNESQERAVSQVDALRRSAESGAAQARESLQVHRTQLDECRHRLSEMEAQVSRSAEAISKYQKDRVEMKNRVRGKVDVIRQQEELLAAKEEELAQLHGRLGDAESALGRAREDTRKRERELSDAKEKLAESAKLLESNQQVITWLNKEVNDAQLGRGSGGGSRPPPSTTYGRFTGNGTRNSSDIGLGTTTSTPYSRPSYVPSSTYQPLSSTTYHPSRLGSSSAFQQSTPAFRVTPELKPGGDVAAVPPPTANYTPYSSNAEEGCHVGGIGGGTGTMRTCRTRFLNPPWPTRLRWPETWVLVLRWQWRAAVNAGSQKSNSSSLDEDANLS